jgi:hypothetical protein
MAKKKNQSKKHKFKYADATPAVRVETELREARQGVQVEPAQAHRPGRVAAVAAGARDFRYVLVDLRRIVVMAAGLVALEAALWVLMTHTGVGSAVYRMVQV